MPGQYFENPHNYSILQSLKGQTAAIKPQVGMPNSPIPDTGNPLKDMLLSMIIFGGLRKAGGVPRATFSDQKPPTSLGWPANIGSSPSVGESMSAGMAGARAGSLTAQNSAISPDIKSMRIPEPGNLNTSPSAPNAGLPPNKNARLHDALLSLLRL